jgi:hypothetical protein
MIEITLSLNGIKASIELFSDHAPITCDRFLAVLPQKIDMHYAKFAGQEVLGLIPMIAPVESGKSLKEINKGCVAYWPDRAFFCIYYGDIQDEEVSVTVIGQLHAGDDFIQEMEKCRYKQGAIMEIYRTSMDGYKPHKFMIDTKLGWDEIPVDLDKVYRKRGIMLPGGPLIYADGETRKLADFVHLLYVSHKANEEIEDKFIALNLDHYAFKIGGWCGLTDCAEDILRYKGLLMTPEIDRENVLVDFKYYINRLNLWVDLLIPWEKLTELIRNTYR